MKKPLAVLVLALFTKVALATSPIVPQPQPMDVQTPGAESLGRDVLAPSRIQELPLDEAKKLLKSTEGDAWKPYAITGMDTKKKDKGRHQSQSKVKARSGSSETKSVKTLEPNNAEQREGARATNTTGNQADASETKNNVEIKGDKRKAQGQAKHSTKKKFKHYKKKSSHAPKSTLYKAATVSLTTAPVADDKQVKLPK